MSVPIDPVEAGYTTTEFWLALITSLGALVQPIIHTGLDATQATALASLIVAVYTIGRSIRKKG